MTTESTNNEVHCLLPLRTRVFRWSLLWKESVGLKVPRDKVAPSYVAILRCIREGGRLVVGGGSVPRGIGGTSCVDAVPECRHNVARSVLCLRLST